MLTDSLLRDPAQLASATSVPPLSLSGVKSQKDRNVEPSARCDRVVADVTGLFALPADLPVPAVDGERVRRLIKSRLLSSDDDRPFGHEQASPEEDALLGGKGDTPALGAIRGVERHQRPVIDREVEPVPVGRDAGCRSYGAVQRTSPVAADSAWSRSPGMYASPSTTVGVSKSVSPGAYRHSVSGSPTVPGWMATTLPSTRVV